jgi:rhamnogalacturonyl hydrolase YesR
MTRTKSIDLDLLYFVGQNQGDQSLIDLATTHADTIMAAILRPDYSSYHLVNFDPRTGEPQAKMTNQGHLDESTWSRGQAWSILGFAQTYTWTKNVKYLDTAIKCAEYFLNRLRDCEEKHHHPFVPAWDFDAVRGIYDSIERWRGSGDPRRETAHRSVSRIA